MEWRREGRSEEGKENGVMKWIREGRSEEGMGWRGEWRSGEGCVER